MNHSIEVNQIELTYLQEPVLKRVSFQVAEGEFFIITGPNGSGKTTLLKAITGMEGIQKGNIVINGQDLSEYSRRELARTVAYVPQNPQQDYPFTVQEIVLMGRSPHLGLLETESRTDLKQAKRAMEAAQLTHLANRKINQLSGGEKQRVLIARALCQEPSIMLLDEPTSSLDLAHQVLIMDFLENLQKEENITIIMVAHDLNLASLYGQRILLLKQGQVYRIGSPKEVLTFENLEKVFECVLLVDESSLNGLPRLTVIPGRYLDKSPVHKQTDSY